MRGSGWRSWAERDERGIDRVPRPVAVVLAVALALHAGWQLALPVATGSVRPLPAPPGERALRLLSLGEPAALARVLSLWLQAFDTQPGVSVPLRDLDFALVEAWLDRIIALDPRARAPLLAASRLYAEAGPPARQRAMLAFVYRKFLEDPVRHWPALAHAVHVAKHRLHNLPLALEYARALARNLGPQDAPAWARQLEIFVLEDMGETESAAALLGALIESGTVSDRYEIAFLRWRLETLRQSAPHAQGPARPPP
jgi:hypothetical protein